jgi:hypothetical protein
VTCRRLSSNEPIVDASGVVGLRTRLVAAEHRLDTFDGTARVASRATSPTEPNGRCRGFADTGRLEENQTRQEGECGRDTSSSSPFFSLSHIGQLLKQGSDSFNQNPASGVTFLQECQLLAQPLDINEIVKFVKDNPMLDKKTIGEYLSNRKNIHILEQYVK